MTQTRQAPLMTASPPALLRRWQRWSWLAGLAWWLLLSLGLLLGLTQLLLHKVLVPKVQEYRPQLERQASELLGVPVRIGSIQTLTGGWIPSFELREVALLGPDGREALKLPRVVAAVSVRSLWSLGFEQVFVDAPQLDVRRDAQGRIRVGGLLFGDDQQTHSPAADWFFSQAEFVIRGGSLQWTDELRAAPSISLSGVNLVIRNPGRHHQFHIEATPQAQWGDRFVAQADFSHGLLQTQEGNWRRWKGNFYLQLGRVDVSELRKHTQLGVQVERGRGAMRLWGELREARVTGLTADVALENVTARLAQTLPPLELAALSGRLGGRQDDEGYEFFTQALQFTTSDGVRWPGGNVFVRERQAALSGQPQGEARADKLDLTTLSQMANRLPLGDKVHEWLRQWAPRGQVETLRAQWKGSLQLPQDWKLQARLSQIGFLSSQALHGEVGRPGVEGLNVELDAAPLGGKARVQIRQGGLTFPGVFEVPRVGVDELQAQLQWSLDRSGPEAEVQITLDQLTFANADAQGSGNLRWRTSRPGEHPAGRLPGVLNLEMQLSRADGTQVYRYLPQTIPQFTRDYLKAAILQGQSSDVKVRVAGNLGDFPFHEKEGQFHIEAPIRGAHYQYVPALPGVNAKAGGTWPAFTELSGLLVFDRNSMEVRQAAGKVAGTKALQVQKVHARIARLGDPVVEVKGEVKGPLAEQLAVVRTSTLNDMTQGVLARASATGDALAQLQLVLPMNDLARSRVQGKVQFNGNDVRIGPDTPLLGRVRAQVGFSEKGFAVKGAQARLLGGDVRLEGGTVENAGPNDASVVLRGQGQATAAGLREARELGLVSQFARGASGTMSYQATLGFRKGQPELQISTNLQGMALQLPHPLVKTAEQALPVRYTQALRKDAQGNALLVDDVRLDVGSLVDVDFVRDLSGNQPRVLRGGIGVGVTGPALPLPESGVAVSVALDKVDLDAWDAILQTSPVPGAVTTPSAAPAYWPNTLSIRTAQMTVAGRQFHRVVVGGTREGMNWRANMSAQELNGYVEYRPGQGGAPGALYARLARLSLAANAASEIESVIEQPSTVPALDIVVEDLEYNGRNFGRLEMDAVNQGSALNREWRLRKLNLLLPEASIQASGNWVRVGAQSASAPAAPGSAATRSRAPLRRTALKFKAEIRDAGEMFRRLGMGDLIRRTPGVVDGQISWVGSPLALDYPSLQGQLHVDLKEGQFLKVDPGAARLLGVLSLQSLPRRLALDFRDVFSEGFAYDNIRGDVSIDNGIARTNNLQMKGVVAGVLMEGSANIARETQDLRVIVVPEINAGTASLFAVAVNPVIGLGTFLAQAVIRRPLIRSATQEFRIEGSWSDPRITKVEPREDATEAAAAAASAAQPGEQK